MNYNFHLSREHFIAEIDGKLYILDTGSPMSFQIGDGPSVVSINGNSFKLSGLGSYIGLRKVDRLVGEPVHGLIGNDILSALGSVCIDRAKGKVCFGDTPELTPATQLSFRPVASFQTVSSSAEGLLGDLVTGLVDRLGGADTVNTRLRNLLGISLQYLAADVEVDGKPVTALLDTGACISYANPELLQDSPVTGRSEDWQPGSGSLHADEHTVTLRLGNTLIPAQISEAPRSVTPQLKLLGAQAVIGFKHFPGDRLLLDYRKGRILAA